MQSDAKISNKQASKIADLGLNNYLIYAVIHAIYTYI